MSITAKGMGMLLKHHALDVNSSSDDDVKNCIDAAIKNSDGSDDDEGGEGDEGEEEETVENRSTDPAVTALTKQVEALTKQLKAKGEPVHNRRTSRTPDVDLDALEAAEEEGQFIANRASELQKLNPGMTLAAAFVSAGKELEKKSKK